MGALRVERVTKPDGRYVLYYSWPDRPAQPDSAGAPAATNETTDSTGGRDARGPAAAPDPGGPRRV